MGASNAKMTMSGRSAAARPTPASDGTIIANRFRRFALRGATSGLAGGAGADGRSAKAGRGGRLTRPVGRVACAATRSRRSSRKLVAPTCICAPTSRSAVGATRLGPTQVPPWFVRSRTHTEPSAPTRTSAWSAPIAGSDKRIATDGWRPIAWVPTARRNKRPLSGPATTAIATAAGRADGSIGSSKAPSTAPAFASVSDAATTRPPRA